MAPKGQSTNVALLACSRRLGPVFHLGQILNLFHCRTLTVFKHIKYCVCFILDVKKTEEKVMEEVQPSPGGFISSFKKHYLQRRVSQ